MSTVSQPPSFVTELVAELRSGLGMLLVLAVVVLYAAVGSWIDPDDSAGWPATVGKISAASVSERTLSRLPVGARPAVPGGRQGRVLFFAEVTYTYQVNGTPYSNHRIADGMDAFETAERAHEVTARYRVGSPVTVYYDPKAPQDAILVPGDRTMAILGILLGGGLLILPILVAGLRVRGRRTNRGDE